MRLLDERLVSLGLVIAVAGCAGGSAERQPGAQIAANIHGPSADYPMVLGEVFTIEGRLYTPADTINFDEVGHATLDANGGSAISASHRTLPLPSYIEVTSLETGRTILARAERRGPMSGAHVVALSPGAMAQLGAAADTPVRVRRVNPPEQERAFLRRGEKAAERMETPMTLVAVLRRKLPQPAVQPLPATQMATPTAEVVPPADLVQPTANKPVGPQKQQVTETRKQAAQTGSFVVQAGAFSTTANAQRVAGKINGTIAPSGRLFIVRTGPFANRGLAEASLAKVKHAGYSDARIFRVE